MISTEELNQVKLTISNVDITEDFLSSFTNELTANNTKSVFSHFFRQYSKHIFEVENQDVMAFFNYLNRLEDTTLRTKKNLFSHFRKFISFLYRKYNKFFDLEQKVDMYFLLEDSSWRTWSKKGHKPKKVQNPLTAKEVETIMNFIKLNDHQKYIMFQTLIPTGMRKGELFSIKIDRIDFITKKSTSLEEYLDMNIIPTDGKTGYKEYPIPEYSNLKSLLKKFLVERRKNDAPHKELFLSNRGTPYFQPTTWINTYLNNLHEQLGFTKPLFPHLFRHTLNTLRERMNCPEDIREFLVGHAPTTSNKKYTHRDRKRKVELATKYNPYKNIEL